MYSIIPRVYDVDYSFIVKNYLNPELWDMKWTLFMYKDFIIYLELYSIDCKDKEITFKLYYNDKKTTDVYSSEHIRYNLQNSSLKILIQQINGAMFRLLEKKERCDIHETEIYKNVVSSYWDEEDTLREIAEDFLNDEGVTNDDIREAYIDTYVCNNIAGEQKKSEVESNLKYIVDAEYFLVLTKAIKDDTRFEIVNDKIKNHTDLDVDVLLKEAQLLEDQDYEYLETLRDNLEAI